MSKSKRMLLLHDEVLIVEAPAFLINNKDTEIQKAAQSFFDQING